MSGVGSVLVVDDEGTIRRACERIFMAEGIRVVTADRGEAAVSLLEEVRPDVVVLDLKMPGMGGVETLRRIRDVLPRLPVVVITGLSTLESRREAMELGATVWLAKPFSPDQLLEAVANARSEEPHVG